MNDVKADIIASRLLIQIELADCVVRNHNPPVLKAMEMQSIRYKKMFYLKVRRMFSR